MGSIADPGELTQPSFDEFQRQTSLMTSCTLLWKELSDHFTSLEQDLLKKSEALKAKLKTLDTQTKQSLQELEKRETTMNSSIEIALGKVQENKVLAINSRNDTVTEPEVDDSEDPARFVLEAISEVFPVDTRELKSDRVNDLGWACVLMLESLIPVMVDPILGSERMLVTPRVKERAKEIAETWKKSLEERGGIENVKTPDVHTFLQHLVTFGIVKKEDVELYRKLVVGSAWRKQMPKLAVSLGLGDKMSDMIEELISRGQQVDAVHFTYEVGLVDKFPPVPLLKAFLKDAKKAATSILEDPNNSGRAALEKTKGEKKRPAAAVPANKRTRASNGGPMPPAKAGRSTNAYVSSFPTGPTFVRSPSQAQYTAGVPSYPASPAMYGHGSRSPPSNPYVYSPEAAPPAIAGPYPGAPMNYPAYGGYGNVMAPAYQQAYYR
ncbi:unnamed protein product [Ilex paraguariensis]|uniref:FRIGIDA-like protein n=1 Tax=Ilex paraguariensis TaxID=185542 RepID=A0ABC8SH28_9AQUA